MDHLDSESRMFNLRSIALRLYMSAGQKSVNLTCRLNPRSLGCMKGEGRKLAGINITTDLNRRGLVLRIEDKGHHCLEDRIYSIRCPASYFAQGRIEE